MHYLSKLLPALVLAASVNARVLDQRLVRRQNNADPLAAAMAAQGAQAGQGAAAPSFRCVCTPIDANAANAEAAAQFTANAATEDLAAAAGAAGEEADAGNATNPGVAAQDAAGAGAGAAGNPAVVAEMNKATAAAANSANAAAAGGNPGAGVNNAGAAAAGAGAAEMGVGGAAAGMAAGAGAGARAIYFQTNQVENAIMMIPVQSDGTLGAGSSIATGGQGGALIDMMTGQPAATDVLASQGAVRVLGNNLFAVNAGSNSLSMFAIDAQGMLTQVGQAVETGGDVSFPFLPPSLSPILHIF